MAQYKPLASFIRPISTAIASGSRPRLAPLPQKSVIELSGPDAQKFLKGLSSKDVEATNGGYSGFMNASGRLLHAVFVLPTPTGYLISYDCPPDHPEPLMKLLPPFRLRSKVKIRDVSEQWDVWTSWDQTEGVAPTRTWKFGSGGAAEAHWEHVPRLELPDGEVGCWDLRAGWGSAHLLIPKGSTPSYSSSFDLASTDDYHLRRMRLGLPEGMTEIIPQYALPLESCMDVHGGVDFRKGCYLGQELTVRTYHTGATRKRILPLHIVGLEGGQIPQDLLGADITYIPPSDASSKRPRPAGKILSMHKTGDVGLGLVRLEYPERTTWSSAAGEKGKILVRAGGREYDVEVSKGAAYRAAEEAASEAHA